MPKLRTHKASAKRVSVTKTGKVQYRHTSGNHFLQKKSAGRKRRIAQKSSLIGEQVKTVKRKLGI